MEITEFERVPDMEGYYISSNVVRCFHRLRCKLYFRRLDAKTKRLFTAMEIDPESKIKRGEI